MNHLFTKCLAILLIALLAVPGALAEGVEAIDEAVPEAIEAIDDVVPEAGFVELDGEDELPVEDGLVDGERYQAEMPFLEAVDGIPIDVAHFPDEVVRNLLLNGLLEIEGNTTEHNDKNRNGWLEPSEIAAITFISINGASDLRGLEFLTALTRVSVSGFTGAAIDLSAMPNLQGCNILSSDVLAAVIFPANLQWIEIHSMPRLAVADISRCTRLKTVRMVEAGKVEAMDFSAHPGLESATFVGEGFKAVTLGLQPNLVTLECYDTGVTTLDITGCPVLLGVVADQYKTTYNTCDGLSCDRVEYQHGNALVKVSSTVRLITGKAREAVTPGADNRIVTTAVYTYTAVDVGQSYVLSALGQKASGFKSSDTRVATVTNSGVIVPKKAGKAKITYKVNGKTRKVILTVKDPTMPTKVSLNMTGTNAAKVGEKITLTATLNEGARSGIKWTTSNRKVAAVKNGVVTFKKAGKVTITVTTKRGNKKAKVKFAVSK